MQKVQVGVLIPPAVRAALEAACEQEGRSLSSMAQRLLTEGLQRGGYLSGQPGQEARQEQLEAA